MKKEIMQLIASDKGEFRINSVSVLHRWTEDGVGQTVDCLRLAFDQINGVEYSGWVMIQSRDYDGILEEIEDATTAFMASVAERLNKNLRNGYIA